MLQTTLPTRREVLEWAKRDPRTWTHRWMNTSDCARLLGRTYSAVKKLVFRGRIPYVKSPPDGRIRFDRIVIHKWMESQQRVSTKTATQKGTRATL